MLGCLFFLGGESSSRELSESYVVLSNEELSGSFVDEAKFLQKNPTNLGFKAVWF